VKENREDTMPTPRPPRPQYDYKSFLLKMMHELLGPPLYGPLLCETAVRRSVRGRVRLGTVPERCRVAGLPLAGLLLRLLPRMGDYRPPAVAPETGPEMETER